MITWGVCLLILAPGVRFCEAEGSNLQGGYEKNISFYATVLKVIDGDSLVVEHDGKKVTIRLWGIDAPEYDQPNSRESKMYLKYLVRDRHIVVTPKDTDKYGRLVALIRNTRITINEELVKSGNAWVHVYFCKEQPCSNWRKLEKKARNMKIGLWKNSKHIAPWVWKSKK